MAKVLVIDDDPRCCGPCGSGLKAGGHDVVTAVNGEQGIPRPPSHAPDIVVLDLGLPDIDGLTVCKRIRQWSEVPIIILSASGTEDRKVAALDGGADDYVTKPFGMAELEARIRTAIRHRAVPTRRDAGTGRSPSARSSSTSSTTRPTSAARPVDLTTKEFDVLSFLARHAGKTCTHQMILSAVWGAGYGSEARYLHAYVHRLRQKLDDARAR